MHRFIHCPHTCGHIDKNNNDARRGYLFVLGPNNEPPWGNHMRQQHWMCNARCPAFRSKDDPPIIPASVATLRHFEKELREYFRRENMDPAVAAQLDAVLQQVDGSISEEGLDPHPDKQVRDTEEEQAHRSPLVWRMEYLTHYTGAQRPVLYSPRILAKEVTGVWVNAHDFDKTWFYEDPATICLIEPRRFRVGNRPIAARSTFFVEGDLLASEVVMAWAKALPGWSFPAINAGESNLFWEWLCVAHALATDSASPQNTTVKLVPYEKYMQALRTRGGPVWDELASAQLVIGGASIGEWMKYPPEAQQGESPDEAFLDALHGLRQLHCSALVWPSFDTNLFQEPKLPLIIQLQRIATTVTRTGYPRVSMLSADTKGNWLDFPSQWSNALGVDGKGKASPNAFTPLEVVVKRGYSACGDHVYDMTQMDSVARLQLEIKANKHTFSKRPSFARLGLIPRWFVVPLVPEMQTMGEARIYFVGGSITHIVGTTKTELVIIEDDLRLLTPLDHLGGSNSRNYAGLMQPSSSQWFNPSIGSRLGKRGREEMLKFATDTLFALINDEEQQFKRISSLRILARLDVSVFFNHDQGRYNYFVNETAVRHTTGLFLGYIGHRRGMVATEIAVALRGLIAYNRTLEAEERLRASGV